MTHAFLIVKSEHLVLYQDGEFLAGFADHQADGSQEDTNNLSAFGRDLLWTQHVSHSYSMQSNLSLF